MRLHVTRFGALTALGGTDAGFSALLRGETGFDADRRARVPAWSPLPAACVGDVASEHFRTLALADTCVPRDIDPVGLAVVFATTTSAMAEGEGDIESVMLDRAPPHPERFFWSHLCHQPAQQLAAILGATGPVMSVSTACTSGTVAIGIGADLVRAGRAKRALVVGADALCKTTVFGFNSLGAYTSDVPRPFDAQRSGMALGEAAAWLLIESGAGPFELLGVATTTDGQHLTAPDPTGGGLIRAIRGALGDVPPSAIDHLNAHATATETNDAAEAIGLTTVAPDAFVSATKGATGHTLGAAGVVEAVFLLQSMAAGVIPPVAGLGNPLSVNVSAALRYQRQRIGVSVNLAFGGHNAAVAFRAV